MMICFGRGSRQGMGCGRQWTGEEKISMDLHCSKTESSFFNFSPNAFKFVCVAANSVHGLSRAHDFRPESHISINLASFSFSLPFRPCDPKAPPLPGILSYSICSAIMVGRSTDADAPW